ncbi:hypothetical protein E4K72_21305 [Oxalobacteraceae bacterium OM1]|nr:hypothetical protein E4K72_21305 [Oxalobacteraceae bacterium OM1]
MSNLKRSSEQENPGRRDEPRSSQGNDSASVTPKDVSPEDAAHRDVTERKLNSKDLEERAQALLDEAVEDTFPASDPIAVPTFEEMLESVKAQQGRVDAEATRGNAKT